MLKVWNFFLDSAPPFAHKWLMQTDMFSPLYGDELEKPSCPLKVATTGLWKTVDQETAQGTIKVRQKIGIGVKVFDPTEDDAVIAECDLRFADFPQKQNDVARLIEDLRRDPMKIVAELQPEAR